MSDSSGYLRYDDSFDYYDAISQHPVLPIPPTSSFSELRNALVEVPQPMSRTSVDLPTLPKHDSSKSRVAKTEYGATANDQPFSSLPVTGNHVPHMKGDSEQTLVPPRCHVPQLLYMATGRRTDARLFPSGVRPRRAPGIYFSSQSALLLSPRRRTNPHATFLSVLLRCESHIG